MSATKHLPEPLLLPMYSSLRNPWARRLKAARIPGKKTLDGFDFPFQPTLSERRLRELADLSFVRTCTNVVFLGPPGTGKTHLSLALANRALTAGAFSPVSHPSPVAH